MKKINRIVLFLSLSIIISFSFNAKAQSTFVYDYSGSNQNYITGDGFIDTTTDGNLMGTLREPDSTLVIFKVDLAGNMIWRKGFIFQHIIGILDHVILSDNTVAYLLAPFTQSYEGLVIKIDFDGNLIWSKGLYISTSASFQTIAPTTDGGLIAAGGGCAGADMIVHLDSYGNIVSQSSHTSSPPIVMSIVDMVHDGNNQYSGWAISLGTSFVFFRCDSAGNFYDVHQYSNIGYNPMQGFGSGNQFIVRSSSGGHYCAFPFAVPVNTFGLFYINALDQLQWVKTIASTDSIFSYNTICSTTDNGSIVLVENRFNLFYIPGAGFPSLTEIINFDSLGSVKWSKMPGDTSTSLWRSCAGRSICPAQDGDWVICSSRLARTNISKTDSLLNGFCSYTQFSPTISNVTFNNVSRTVVKQNLNFITIPVSMGLISAMMFRFDACSGTLIDSVAVLVPEIVNEQNSFSLSPNPATNQLTIESAKLKITSIEIYDMPGQKVYSEQQTPNNTRPDNFGKQLTINITKLNAGIYFVKVSDGQKTAVKKVVKM